MSGHTTKVVDVRLHRVVVSGLRAAINDHGPITADMIGSAAKRITGNLLGSGIVWSHPDDASSDSTEASS
jgi:metal-dependent HD superfamily phosphatase/phosphodiesterase